MKPQRMMVHVGDRPDVPWYDVDLRLMNWLFPEKKPNLAAAFPWGLALIAAYLLWSKRRK